MVPDLLKKMISWWKWFVEIVLKTLGSISHPSLTMCSASTQWAQLDPIYFMCPWLMLQQET
jgi:hypothetical protein